MTEQPDTIKALKSSLKLDFSAPPAPSKVVHQRNITTPIILSMLRSPDFEQRCARAFLTPSAPKNVTDPSPTEACKQYAQGFVDALMTLHKSSNMQYDAPSPSLLTPLLNSPMRPRNFEPVSIAAEFQAFMHALKPPSTPVRSVLYDDESMKMLQHVISAASSQSKPVASTVSQNMQSLSALSSLAASSSSSFSSSDFTVPLPLPSAISCSLTSLQNGFAHNAVKPAPPPKMESRTLPLEMPSRPISVDSMSSQDSSIGQSSSCGRLLPSRGERLEDAAMDEQERRKLERKRLRNRVAASKCRQKKLERIADLEAQVADQKKVTAQLETDIIACRRLLEQIEHEVKQHYARGCQQHTNFGYMLKPKH